MKTLKLIIILSLLFNLSSIEAQENIKGQDFIDVIYLKNGSVFRGNILKYEQGKQVLIEIAGDNQLTFSEADILKIRQERLDEVRGLEEQEVRLKKREKPTKVYQFKEKGWYNVTYFALANGSLQGDLQFGIGLHNITGYMLSRHLGIGLGIGVDNYAVGEGEVVYPVFVEARGYLTPTYKSLYYSMAAGYGLAFKNKNNFVTRAQGGYMLHPAIGVRLGASKESNLTLDLGVKFQRADFTKELPFSGEIDIREVTYRRITIRIGLLF